MPDISLSYLELDDDDATSSPAVPTSPTTSSPASPTAGPTSGATTLAEQRSTLGALAEQRSALRTPSPRRSPGWGAAHVKVAAEQTEARGVRCQAPGCYSPVYRWGAFCSPHAQAYIRNGHTSHRAIHGEELRPFRRTARAFIETYTLHPGIKSGLAWIAGQIEEGVRRGPAEKPRGAATRAFLYWKLAQLRDVDPKDILELIFASHLHRAHRPGRYAELPPSLSRGVDLYFRFTLAKVFMWRAPQDWGYSNGNRYPKSHRPMPFKVQALLGERIVTALGVLAHRATEAMMPNPGPEITHVDGAFQSFDLTRVDPEAFIDLGPLPIRVTRVRGVDGLIRRGLPAWVEEHELNLPDYYELVRTRGRLCPMNIHPDKKRRPWRLPTSTTPTT